MRGGELGAGGRGEWSKMPRRGEGLKVCRIFYLEHHIHELAVPASHISQSL